MIIDGIGFNEGWAKSVTEKEFVEHLLPHHFQKLEKPERKNKLKEVYRLLCGEVPVEVKDPVE